MDALLAWVINEQRRIARTAAGYGIVLPASPVDGQEFVLVDSITAPTYQWRFRYNAGSASTYKWEFIGGTPAVIGPTTQSPGAGNTTVDGVGFTLPRAGDYIQTVSGYTANIFGGTSAAWLGTYDGTTRTQVSTGSSAGDAGMTFVGTTVWAGKASSTVLQVSAHSSGGGAATFNNVVNSILPKRVS